MDKVEKAKPKIMAQRKFASFPAYCTYLKPRDTEFSTISELFPKFRPLTEDFLTFICFRGTNLLPPHLDFYALNGIKEPKNCAIHDQSSDHDQSDDQKELSSSELSSLSLLPEIVTDLAKKRNKTKTATNSSNLTKKITRSEVQDISRRTLANKAKRHRVVKLLEEQSFSKSASKVSDKRDDHTKLADSSNERKTRKPSAQSLPQAKDIFSTRKTRRVNLSSPRESTDSSFSPHKKSHNHSKSCTSIESLAGWQKILPQVPLESSDRVLRSHGCLKEEIQLPSNLFSRKRRKNGQLLNRAIDSNHAKSRVRLRSVGDKIVGSLASSPKKISQRPEKLKLKSPKKLCLVDVKNKSQASSNSKIETRSARKAKEQKGH